MKFIHTADLHLDSAFTTIDRDKAKLRKAETVQTFERLCDYAKTNGVRAVIISGDMFDTDKITVKTSERVFYAIKNCPETDFIYISGNHDSDAVSKLKDLPENFKLCGNGWTYFDYKEAVISGVSFDKNNAVSVYDTLSLDKDRVNIVSMHGQIAGYKTDEKAELISLPRLKDKNIDYLALGHIHYYVEDKLDLRGKFSYSGCLEGRGFDETGKKGFILIEVEDKKLSTSFVPFSCRELYTEEYTVDGQSNVYEFYDSIIKDLTEKYKETSLIKVILKGEHTPDFMIDKDNLASKLNNRFFFAKVYDNTVLKINEKDFELDKSVRGEFVRQVLNSNLSEQDKNSVIMCGINALSGEEIL